MRMITDMDDDEKGKLFVGGLSWETTQETLQRFFQRYGEVIDCVVMKNNESGRSRGFGFVTYKDPLNVNVVLKNGPHSLDGRTIDPKPCNPRTMSKPKKGGGYPKVFLGGLPSNVTETDLRVFFGRYGKVMEVVIMYDQEKKKSRGFGFLSFEDDASVERVTMEHYINLNGKQVEIKKAEPRDGSSGNNMINIPPNANHNKVMNNDNSHWPPSQNAPINIMQPSAPNGQMGPPPINMTMSPPNMMQGMQGYQNWGGNPQQQNYGYGTPSGPSSYHHQGWAAPPPPGPQGHPPPPPHQWNNYPNVQQNPQPYGSYGPNTASNAAPNWNTWNMQQGAATTSGNEMYSRGPNNGSSNINVIPASNNPPNNGNKVSAEYCGGYGPTYGTYNSEQNSSYRPRCTYNNDNINQYPSQPQADEF